MTEIELLREKINILDMEVSFIADYLFKNEMHNCHRDFGNGQEATNCIVNLMLRFQRFGKLGRGD